MTLAKVGVVAVLIAIVVVAWWYAINFMAPGYTY